MILEDNVSEFSHESSGIAPAAFRKHQDCNSDISSSQIPSDECSSLVHISEELLRRLQADRGFVRLSVGLEIHRAVEQVCGWIHTAAVARGVTEFNEETIASVLPEGATFDAFFAVLLDTMRRPIPLGEDVLGYALSVLSDELRDDARVVAFLDLIVLTPSVASAFSQFAATATQTIAQLTNAASTLAANTLAVRQVSPQESTTPRSASDDELDMSGEPSNAQSDYSEGLAMIHTPLGDMFDPYAHQDDEEIDTGSLGNLVLPPDTIKEMQKTWIRFIELAGNRENAGKMVFDALFEGASSLQPMFTTPRPIQAGRFVTAVQGLIDTLQEPPRLRSLCEVLGFQHMTMEITLPRSQVFRNNLVDTMKSELAEEFSDVARTGWVMLVNYACGAMIYVKSHYSQRLHVLLTSWRAVNDENASELKARGKAVEEGSESSGSKSDLEAIARQNMADKKAKGKKSARGTLLKGAKLPGGDKTGDSEDDMGMTAGGLSRQVVPTTFNEMFEVNAAVMGFSKNMVWFKQILLSLDAIVNNAVNSVRLQEECDILSLRIAKTSSNPVNFSEFKSCMLAALGSLLPKSWDAVHEVAWSWLWENVERLLLHTFGHPPKWEHKVGQLMANMDEDTKRDVRQKIYDRFFELAPTGQDYFKQSSTRLHYIASRVMEMTVDLYKEPWRMVEAISAVGLRHVGYGVPTELFGPFLSAHLEVMRTQTEDNEALEAYQWSLSLIVKILIRNINEGSTIVMKAINANSVRMLKHALSQAPRCERVEWLLNIQVGPCKISPLEWAIESGSLEVANAAIQDLLTIRADRDKYYFGVDELFRRHPDFVQRLCDEAPSLLPTLLEGLVWRSRQTQNGVRRVNYFVKHLIINEDGTLSDALRALAASKDQTIISHPVVVLVSDTLWTGVIRRSFFLSKLGFIFSVLVFMLSQAILPKAGMDNSAGLRIAVLTGRITTYVFSLGRLSFTHGRQIYQGYRTGRTIRIWRIPIPRYLRDTYKLLGFTLVVLLIAMCCHEPMFYCIGSPDWPTEECPLAEDVEWRYTMICMVAMAIHWMLLVDMAAFSTKLQAFLLVFRHVMSELGRFLVAMLFLLATFSSAIACLRHQKDELTTILKAANCLFAITVGLYEGDYREFSNEPWLLIAVFLFVTVSTIVLINLLIAQLNCSYEYVYQDMVGFARLARAQLIVETLATCPAERWNRFVESMQLDQCVEFDEGDVGMAGGIQVRELASMHPSAEDSIHRFGGSCTPDMPWPEPEEEEDRVERVERLIHAAYKMAGKLQENDGASGSQFSASRQGVDSQGDSSSDASSVG